MMQHMRSPSVEERSYRMTHLPRSPQLTMLRFSGVPT